MKKILLSAIGLLGLTMQPDLPEISEPQKWRHLYKVFYRNAVNETQVWQLVLKDSLAVMGSLLRIRDIPEETTPSPLAHNRLVSDARHKC